MVLREMRDRLSQGLAVNGGKGAVSGARSKVGLRVWKVVLVLLF